MAATTIPMNLFNTTNKLWLLSSNIIGADKDATINHLIKDYKDNRIGKRLEADKCIKFDAMSVGVAIDLAKKDDTINNIIAEFYAYAVAVVTESHTRQREYTNANHNVLFQNPFFGESDSTFLGPDGVHDADPRGDMAGSKITQKSADTKKSNKITAGGGWRLISNTWIDGGREQLHDAIMRSTVCPTKEFCDDIAVKEIDRTSWTTAYIKVPGSFPPTLNPSSGHRFLSPIAEAERYISNVIYPMVETCDSIAAMRAVQHYNTKIVHLKHPDPKGVFDMAELTDAIREKYNLSKFVHNYGISDCSGPSPDELNMLLGAQEDESVVKTKKQKKDSNRVVVVTSHVMDSSTGNDDSAMGSMDKISVPGGDVAGGVPNIVKNQQKYITFIMPHTRWNLTEDGAGAGADQLYILYVYQRVMIDNSNPAGVKYKIQFEAPCF